MRTLGIAGMAKNTGKTTLGTTLVQALLRAGRKVALTSIGIDSESRDPATGLPQPRYYLPAGTWIATARECLALGTACFRIEERTPVRTILGPVVIAEVTEPGLVLLAGPNRLTSLNLVLARFISHEMEWAVVDGSLKHLVPLAAAEGVVFATGAAVSPDEQALAHHAAALVRLFELPICSDPAGRQELQASVHRLGESVPLPQILLAAPPIKEDLFANLQVPYDRLVLPGSCCPQLLRELAEAQAFHPGTEIVFGSPLRLLSSAHPQEWASLFDCLKQQSIGVSLQSRTPLRALALNPYYPRYDPTNRETQPAYLDARRLLAAVREQVNSIPVLDVRQSAEPDLLAAVESTPT